MIQKLKAYLNRIRLNTIFFFRKYRLALATNKQDVRHLLPQLSLKKKWYGSSYGGFYVCPEHLNSQSIVYSFGIGKDISFDKKIIRNHSCQVFGFDPTPKSIDFIKALKPIDNFHFYPFGISTKSGIERFFMPKDDRGVSGSLELNHAVDEDKFIEVSMQSLPDIVQLLKHNRIDLLKIDIEGSEYELMQHILQTPVFIGQILVEFHDRMFPGNNPKSIDTIKLLQKYGYQIYACSISFEEISLIHKSFYKDRELK